MLRLAILVTVVAAAVGVRTVMRLPDPVLDDDWSIYKKIYNKVYQPTEDYYRRTVFEDNSRFIEEHNIRADEGRSSYRLGMNEFGDMTNEEFVKQMNGYRMRPSINRPTFKWPEGATLNDLPTTVDWRTKGYVTPVKNQGQCGSCWAFSATGSLEGQHFNATKKLVSLSEQNLVDCSTKQGNQGCNGGLMDQAFTYIKVNKGIDTEVTYPYKGVDDSCHFNATNVGATDTGFVDVKSGSEADLQAAVATIGPVSVAIDANHISFQLYRSGVFHDFLCSSKRLDHGVLAVGYGVDGGKDYWLVKNSWGTVWGMKGYIMMSRNRDNNCGIATAASYPTV